MKQRLYVKNKIDDNGYDFYFTIQDYIYIFDDNLPTRNVVEASILFTNIFPIKLFSVNTKLTFFLTMRELWARILSRVMEKGECYPKRTTYLQSLSIRLNLSLLYRYCHLQRLERRTLDP